VWHPVVLCDFVFVGINVYMLNKKFWEELIKIIAFKCFIKYGYVSRNSKFRDPFLCTISMNADSAYNKSV
jgi:hypothetical protein